MSLADELTKLEELRRSGALTEAEFARAKAALLNQPPPGPDGSAGQHLAEHLAGVQYQNELARIDREWEMERQQYLITDRYGRQQVPTPGMGIGVAVVGGVFGVFWTIVATTITGFAPAVGPFGIVKVVFPAFGILFIVAAVGFGIFCYSRAQRYRQAYDAYVARRQEVRPEKFR